MAKPIIRSGRFTAGADLTCGENVVVEIAKRLASEVLDGGRVG